MKNMIFPILLPAIVILIMIAVMVYQRLHILILRKKLMSSMRENAGIKSFIALFSHNLRGGQNSQNWMNITARYVMELVDARSVCIYLLHGDNLVAEGLAGVFPLIRKNLSQNYVMTKPKYILEQLSNEPVPVGKGLIGEVALNRKSVFLENAMEDPRISAFEPAIPVDAVMALPLINEGVVKGVICAVNTSEKDQDWFTSDQFARFQSASTQAVLAISFLEAYSHLTEQQRLQQELKFALALQQSMLPKKLPVWGRFLVYASTRSSKEVSGDFYDFVELDRDRLLVVIGDACGKGIPACMVMSITHSYIRSNIKNFTSLQNFLIGLNDNIYRDTGDERYVTLACCILNKRDVTFEYARAGHTELMLNIRDHMRIIYPDGSGIGLMPSEFTSFDTFCMSFTPGMTALLFTDGLNEATNSVNHKEEFGLERLRAQFRQSCAKNESPEEFFKSTFEKIDTFAGTPNGENQEDDQTMVLIRHV